MNHDTFEMRKKAEECYEMSIKKCEMLDPTDIIKLSAILNYSIFNYEINQKPMDAVKLSKKAFDDAHEFGIKRTIDTDSQKAFLILSLFKDHLRLWTSKEHQLCSFDRVMSS